MSKAAKINKAINWGIWIAGAYFIGTAIAGAIKRKREGTNGIGARYEDMLPTVMQYSRYLDIAQNKFGISREQARRKYGLYTIGQWNKLLGIGVY